MIKEATLGHQLHKEVQVYPYNDTITAYMFLYI